MDTATQPAPPPSIAHRVVNDEPISAEEYLERERAATQERHEYIDGWVIRVSGASIEHNFIVSNLNRELGNQLRETDCRVTANDLRVAFPSLDKYAYPDVVAFCGEPELEEEHLDMLYNPTLIVEVLSPTTEDYDHGKKFSRYRQIDPFKSTSSSPRTPPTSSTTSARTTEAGASPRPTASTPRSPSRPSSLNFPSPRSILTYSRTNPRGRAPSNTLAPRATPEP